MLFGCPPGLEGAEGKAKELLIVWRSMPWSEGMQEHHITGDALPGLGPVLQLLGAAFPMVTTSGCV